MWQGLQTPGRTQEAHTMHAQWYLAFVISLRWFYGKRLSSFKFAEGRVAQKVEHFISVPCHTHADSLL